MKNNDNEFKDIINECLNKMFLEGIISDDDYFRFDENIDNVYSLVKSGCTLNELIGKI